MNYTVYLNITRNSPNTRTDDVNNNVDNKILKNKDNTNKILCVFDNKINNEINDFNTISYNQQFVAKENNKILQNNENKEDANKTLNVFDNTINNEINNCNTRNDNHEFVANDFSINNNFLLVPGLFIPLKKDFSPEKENFSLKKTTLTIKQIIELSIKKLKKSKKTKEFGLLKKILIKNFTYCLMVNIKKISTNGKRESSVQK